MKRSVLNMNNFTVMNHPLISHKLAFLRHVDTDGKEFRELVSEIAMLICYEATRDMKTTPVDIPTPLMTAKCEMITTEKPVLVPILRAGLGMVNGIHVLMPTAPVGHIGMYRDEETFEPQEYYCKLPEGIEERLVLVVDPMLATGGSACDAVARLKARGCKNIKFMCVIGAPEGISRLAETHPDIQVYVASADRCLNEKGYILPGLGDAGDRLFGTK